MDVRNYCSELIDEFGGNALTVYCRYVYTPELLNVVRYLCNGGIDVNERDHNERNALLAFLDNEKFICDYPKLAHEIVDLLISFESNVHHSDYNKEDALWKLMNASTDPKIVFPIARALLANGADINVINPEVGMNAAVLFLRNRDVKLCRKSADNSEEEAFYLDKMIELFLYYGLNLNETKNFLNLLLCDRAKHQPIFIETVKLALKYGAITDYKDDEDGDCLHCCCWMPHHAGEIRIANLVKLLIDTGIDVNQTSDGFNLLGTFLMSIDSPGPDELNVISLLCEAGINVNQQFQADEGIDKIMDSLRLTCALYGNQFCAKDVLSIARILVAHGACVEPREKIHDVFVVLFNAYIITHRTIPAPLAPPSSEDELIFDSGLGEIMHVVSEDEEDEQLEEIKNRLEVQASLEKWLEVNTELRTISSKVNCTFSESQRAYPGFESLVAESDMQSNEEVHSHKKLEVEISQDTIDEETESDFETFENMNENLSSADESDGDFAMSEDFEESDGTDEYTDSDIEIDEGENQTIGLNVRRRAMLPPVDEGWYELFKFLLENGANNGHSSQSKNILLMFLAHYQGKDFVKIIELFCQYGADVNQEAKIGKRALNAIDCLLGNKRQKKNREAAIVLLLDYGLNASFAHPKYRTLFVKRATSRNRNKNVIPMIENACRRS